MKTLGKVLVQFVLPLIVVCILASLWMTFLFVIGCGPKTSIGWGLILGGSLLWFYLNSDM